MKGADVLVRFIDFLNESRTFAIGVIGLYLATKLAEIPGNSFTTEQWMVVFGIAVGGYVGNAVHKRAISANPPEKPLVGPHSQP